MLAQTMATRGIAVRLGAAEGLLDRLLLFDLEIHDVHVVARLQYRVADVRWTLACLQVDRFQRLLVKQRRIRKAWSLIFHLN